MRTRRVKTMTLTHGRVFGVLTHFACTQILSHVRQRIARNFPQKIPFYVAIGALVKLHLNQSNQSSY